LLRRRNKKLQLNPGYLHNLQTHLAVPVKYCIYIVKGVKKVTPPNMKVLRKDRVYLLLGRA
jgi:hypothetical protein